MTRNLIVSFAITMLMFVLASSAMASTAISDSVHVNAGVAPGVLLTTQLSPGNCPPIDLPGPYKGLSYSQGSDGATVSAFYFCGSSDTVIDFAIPLSDLSVSWFTSPGNGFGYFALAVDDNVNNPLANFSMDLIGPAPNVSESNDVTEISYDISFPFGRGGTLTLVGPESEVPEPSSLLLLGSGLLGLAGLFRRKISVCS